MFKKFLFVFSFVVILASLSHAQWTYVGGFPNEDLKGNNHALAVDPDGKVWVSDYYVVDSLQDGTGAWKKVRTIMVFNADGTPASFSPIKVMSGAGFQDTLWNSTKGMNVDENGNIIYTCGWTTKFVKGPWIYRINYKTGECMGGVDLYTTLNTSPTTPAIDDMGNIYCRSVLPGEPTLIYDKDFNFVGNVLDADPGYARITVISGDGMTYYDCSYTMPGIMIYTRASEFDPFTLTDSLYGFKTESAVWDPLESNLLWASSGNIGYSDPGLFNGTYQLTDGNWYKIDIATKTLKDSVEWHFYGDRAQSGAGEKQRSIAFSPDGKTCYLGAFGTAGLYPLVEKFTKGSTGVEQDKTEKPSKFNLAQNYPNPFNPTTKINFSVVENGMVTLKVYNLLGQEVATLVNETLNAGVYNVDFDASKLTSGTYLYEITAGNFSSSKKMLLVK